MWAVICRDIVHLGAAMGVIAFVGQDWGRAVGLLKSMRICACGGKCGKQCSLLYIYKPSQAKSMNAANSQPETLCN